MLCGQKTIDFLDIAELSSCGEYNLFSCPSDENHVTKQI